MQNRSGHYLQQPTGYRAFVPKPLPPEPPIDLDGPDAGDWEGWLGFFLRGVAEVSREATKTAAAILRMRDEYRARIADEMGRAAGNGHRIMEKLFDHPVVTVGRVRQWLGITPAGANLLVSRLVAAGVLREITGYARNRRFVFDPYLRLFEEPAVDAP